MPAFRWAAGAVLTLAACTVAADEKPTPRSDFHGDPLPEGAVARLGTVRLQTYSYSVAFSADGKRLATGNYPHTARVWDTTTGREVVRFEGNRLGYQVWHATLSPDGKVAATLDADNGVLLWDAQTGKFLRGTGGPDEPRLLHADTFTFSPQSDTFYVGSVGRVRAIRVADGKSVDPPAAPEKGLTLAVVSPGGTTAGSLAEDGRLVIWDVAKTQSMGEVAGVEKLSQVAIAPGGKRVAVTTQKHSVVIVHDLIAKKELCQCKGHQTSVSSMAFSPDGKSLITGSGDLTARMWDATTGKERWSYLVSAATFYWVAVAFSPNGDTVGVAGSDGGLRLLDAVTGKECVRGPNPEFGVYPLAVAPDGKSAFAVGRGAICRWNLTTGEGTLIRKAAASDHYDPATGRVVHAGEHIHRMAVRADGATLLLSGLKGVELLDVKNPARPREKFAASTEGCLTPDGKTLAVIDTKLKLVDVASKKIIHQAPNPDAWGHPCFSPDGRILAVGSQDATVQLFDGRTLRRTAVLRDRGGQALSWIEFSPDGQLLASSGGDWRVDIWEIASGKLRQTIERPKSMMNAVAFSPDGRYLAYGGMDHLVCIRDLTTDKEVHTFRGHDGNVITLSFTPDGRRLISSSSDGTALVWDMKAVRTLEPKNVDRTAKELDTLWEQLGGEARAAAEAMRELRRSPTQAVELLGQRVKSADKAKLTKLALLVRDLDSDVLAERDRATAALQDEAEEAVEALRAALADEPTPEMERRANALLARLEGKPASPERLRAIRGVQVLEWIGTDAARKELETLAAGVSEAELTRLATAALGCLSKR